MGKFNDSSRFDEILAEEKAIYPRVTWSNAQELHLAMGDRPLGTYLAKRDQTEPHGPSNSFWALTLDGKKAKRKQEMQKLVTQLVFGKPRA